MGYWTVVRVAEYGRVCALNEGEIAAIIGNKVKFSESSAAYESNICREPIYSVRIIGEDEFFRSNGYISLQDLGIQGDQVFVIEVFEGKESYGNLWSEFGGGFFLKDSKTVFAVKGGVVFELQKN